MVADAEFPEERWPVIVAFALGVVLAGFVMVQLVRRVETDPLATAPTGVVVPPTVASAPGVTTPAAPPSAVPAAAPERATDTPPTPPLRIPTGTASSVAPGDTAPSAVDALDVVDDFRRAYEQRNVERLGDLFAKDAHKGNLAGRDAILADYRRFFTNARDLLYSQPSAAVEPHADHVVVRAPFEITYKDATNRAVEVRGTAAWTLVRRDGATVIRSLDFELTPPAASRR